jgi:magnesium transporter
MITHYFRTLKDTELKTLDEPRSGVWTHVVGASDEEIEYLTKEFALDEAVLLDAQDFFEVPRLERSGGVTYFFARYPYEQQEEDVDTAPLLIVMGESFVITIALKDVPQFQRFIDGKEVIHTTQKAKFFIQLIGTITRSYERKLVRLRRAVHRDRVRLRHVGSRQIVRFVDYEHELNDMMSAVVPMNAWLQQVTTGTYMQLYNEDIELMEDLMIANSQLLDSARSVLKTLQNVRTASEAILTNNLNATIRTLTILTILLTIPTIIASLYGMNIALPLMEHPHAFWLVTLAILTVVSLVIWTFRRMKWL